MAQIDDKQGAIKSSEIYTDSEFTAFGTPKGEDNLTVIQQLTQLSLDSFFKQGIMPFSLGYINWDGSKIDFDQDDRANDIYLRALQTDIDSLRTIDIVLKANKVANSANEFKNITLAHNELLYVELTRQNLVSSGGTLQLENAVGGGSLVNGKTVRKVSLSASTGLEQIKSLVSGDGSSLFIPICFRNTWTDGVDTYDDLLWCINEERWVRDTKNMLGSAQAKSLGGDIINFLETSDPSISWDAEVGIQNIFTYNDGSALPVDATGGSVNANFIFDTTATPAEVLSGDNSFVIEKASVGSMQGHGISFDVQIFAGYRTREVVFKCLFNKISGTYNEGDIQVFVIADPSGTPTLITPINNKIGAMMGEMSATFFPFAGVEDYRICFHLTTTNSNTFKIALDDIKLNPIYYTTADTLTGPQPAGTITSFGGNLDPDGWMVCDGRELSRAAYPELFGNIGTSFGSESGTTFRIPDFRGMFLRGKAPSLNVNITSVDIGTDTITIPFTSGIRTGTKVRFTTGVGGVLPSGISADTDYWVILFNSIVPNTLRFSLAKNVLTANDTTYDGDGISAFGYDLAMAGTSNVDITTTGSGIRTVVQSIDPDANARRASAIGSASGNNIGSFEFDEFRLHKHGITMSHEINGGKDAAGYPAVDGTGPIIDHGVNNGDGSVVTTSGSGNPLWKNGGNETRPLNVAVNYIIKLYNDRKNTVLSNARVEYTSNSNSTNATSDSTSFFNGVEGSPIPDVQLNVAGVIVQTTRNVSFLSAITTSDTMKLQVDCASGGLYWVDAAALFPKIEYPTISILANTTGSGAIPARLEITNISNLSGVSVGMTVTGSGIPAGTTIVSVNPITGTFTLSNPATVTASSALLQLGGVKYGMYLQPDLTSSTRATVTFGNAGAAPNISWSSLVNYRWRVVKATNNLAIEVISKDNAGVVKLFAGSVVPNGWLECNGQSLLRSAYTDLFAAIGTDHGSASSLHFNVPDMRGMTVKGPVGFDTVNVAVGAISGQNITVPSHPFQRTGVPVQLSGTSMPSPLAAITDYYVIVVDANTIRLATTRVGALAGTAITMAATNANAITITQYLDTDFSTSLQMTTGATSNTYQESAFGLGGPGGGGAYNESGVFLRTMLMKYIIKT